VSLSLGTVMIFTHTFVWMKGASEWLVL